MRCHILLYDTSAKLISSFILFGNLLIHQNILIPCYMYIILNKLNIKIFFNLSSLDIF